MAVRIMRKFSRRRCSRCRLTETLMSGITPIVRIVSTVNVTTNSISVKPR
jgi:hypothetical protein